MSCPYQPLLSTYGPPNVKWCEESLCAIVQEPANTWSNLLFIFVGLWILTQARKRRPFVALGLAITIMGTLSLVYHASNLYPTQLGDFLGMFLYLSLLHMWNIRRAGVALTQNASVIVYFLIVYMNIGMLVLFPMIGLRIQLIIFINTLIVFAEEAFLARGVIAEMGRSPYRNYMLGVVFVCAAAVCSALDYSRRWCDPTNHWIQGHAVWHLLSAVSVIFVFRFYNQIGTGANVRAAA